MLPRLPSNGVTFRVHQSRKTERVRAEASRGLTAAGVDRHALYEQSVQAPEVEIRFLDRVYRKFFGRTPRSLREDFCGTAMLSCMWVRHRGSNLAVGVDLDPQVLKWAKEHNLSWLDDSASSRIQLINGDVLTQKSRRTDIVVAFNFSFCVFKTRSELLKYFRSAFRHLRPQGLFVCDIYGGYEAQQEVEEKRRCGGFTYVWDQVYFNPITQETRCHIHFRFPDGTEIRRAFSYDWRLWTIPEIREVMIEAGFSDTRVYWEGTSSKGDGNGIFRPTEVGEVCAGWVAYIVGAKDIIPSAK